MKKIILGLVFLFGISISVDAKTIVQQDAVSDCIIQSFWDYNVVFGITGNADLAFEVSENLLSECLTEAGIN